MTSFAIRLMCSADLVEVVAIHRESFPDSRSTQLGRPFLIKMYRWFIENQPELSLVAVVGNRPIGFVTGAIGGYSRRVFRYSLLQILWGFICRPTLLFCPEMFELWQSYLRGLLPGNDSTPRSETPSRNVKASLASIAVSVKARGNRVGDSLVGAFESAAQHRGATLLCLSVDRDNIAARHLYERFGWKVAREGESSNGAYYIKELAKV